MKFSSTVIINRPLKEVWEFFDDPDNLKLWLTGFIRFEPLSGTPGSVGARSKHVYEMNGRTFELIEEVTHREEYRRLNGEFTSSMMDSRISNTFHDLNTGSTKVQSESDVTFKGIMKLFSLFMKNGFRQRQDADLNKLKMVIETR